MSPLQRSDTGDPGGKRGKPPPLDISVVLEAHGPLASDRTVKGGTVGTLLHEQRRLTQIQADRVRALVRCYAGMPGGAYMWDPRWGEGPWDDNEGT